MIETSACTLAHRTLDTALIMALCDGYSHGTSSSTFKNIDLKTRFLSQRICGKIKQIDKLGIHMLNIGILCASFVCYAISCSSSFRYHQTRIDPRWYVPEETVRIGRCKAASRRRNLQLSRVESMIVCFFLKHIFAIEVYFIDVY